MRGIFRKSIGHVGRQNAGGTGFRRLEGMCRLRRFCAAVPAGQRRLYRLVKPSASSR